MKIGGLEFDGKISVTSALAAIMAFTGAVGAWYSMGARVKATEDSITYLKEARQKDETAREQIKQALSDVNVTVGKIEQRLEDYDSGPKPKPGGN